MSLTLPLRSLRPTAIRQFSWIRAFTTTSINNAHPHAQRRRHSSGKLITGANEKVFKILETPEYPYGPSHTYKQSNTGLYGGLRIGAGNNVSHKTKTKTRRTWKPNIQRKRVYSVALRRFVHLKVATRVLRTIDKVGGLDEYVLGEKPARIKELGPFGWNLRWVIMQTPKIRARYGQQAKDLGIAEETRFRRGWMNKDEVTEYLSRLHNIDAQTSERTYQSTEAGLAEQSEDALQEIEEEAEELSQGESELNETGEVADELSQGEEAAVTTATDSFNVSSFRPYTLKARVIKLHNDKGRRGRRSKRQELAVLREVPEKKQKRALNTLG